MALVLLPGLNNLIDDISEEKKLPSQVVEAALREALLKGYERYRRTLYLGISEDPFEDDYFSNFDVGLGYFLCIFYFLYFIPSFF